MKYVNIYLILALSFFLLNGCFTTGFSEKDIKNRATEMGLEQRKSSFFVSEAWKALEEERYVDAIVYTRKCEEFYGDTAKEMNSELTLLPMADKANDYWALNDVATSLFIAGEVYKKKGMREEEKEVLIRLVSNYYFGQCFDPKGWYWTPANAAAERLGQLGVVSY